MNRQRVVPGTALCMVLLAGCAEYTTIRTTPQDATVSVDGRAIGLSPATLVVPRSELRDRYHVTLEKEGYLTKEATFQNVTGAGRIVGGLFSLGISLIFKGPTTFEDEYAYTLERDPRYAAAAASAYEDAGRPRPTVEQRLEQLKGLLDQGVIGTEEYDRYRQQILSDL